MPKRAMRVNGIFEGVRPLLVMMIYQQNQRRVETKLLTIGK